MFMPNILNTRKKVSSTIRKKRNMLERDGNNSAKRIKLESHTFEIVYPNKPGLLSLSDDVLLMIFKYVHPVDLTSLARTCQRLGNVCCDKTLWTKVDLRPLRLSPTSLRRCTQFFQAGTKFLASQGFINKRDDVNRRITLPRSFIRSVTRNASNLTTLILERHVIDSTKIILEEFPPSLEHLAIRNCIMVNLPHDKSYFLKLYKILPKMKILDLTGNGWFPSHSLLALSKSLSLEELILDGCDVTDSLPYASLAANFGFSALKALDLRNTNVSDIELTCFNRMQTLRRLYLCGRLHGRRDQPIYDPKVTDHSIITFGSGYYGVGNNARFGRGGAVVDDGIDPVPVPEVVIIQVGSYQRTPCKLETLVIRNYPSVTDVTLRHAAANMKHLKFIDVRGSGCSQRGIIEFKRVRPDVRIKPSFSKKTV